MGVLTVDNQLSIKWFGYDTEKRKACQNDALSILIKYLSNLEKLNQ
jgi:hypothetical protein